jgi:hypothetical protein
MNIRQFDTKNFKAWMNRDAIVLKQVKKDKNIIYGAQSIGAQIPKFISRPTTDYDVYSKNPRASARKLDRSLDRSAGGNYYYSKPAQHPGTYKVKYVGPDGRANTKDDVSVADFSSMPNGKRYVNINGYRYIVLSAVIHDKLYNSKPFRREKDQDDVRRIREGRKWI